MEFGIPSENPFLDGPEITQAHSHVTNTIGIDEEIALSMIGGLRDISQPRFVMTYAHEGRELDGFIKLCLMNGIQGILVPDICIEEAQRISAIASSLNLAYIGFVHDQMDENTIEQTVKICDIIYLKISSGPTGQKGELSPAFIEILKDRISIHPTSQNCD